MEPVVLRPSGRSLRGDARPRHGGAPRILVVTGHLAPNRGGVETFTDQIVRRLPWERLTVMAPEAPGQHVVDRMLPFEVVRYPGRLLGHPRLAMRLGRDARALGIDAAWITSGMPLGVLAVPLRRAGVERIVISTHGMEVGWAKVPGVRRILKKVAAHADVVTYLGDYTRAGPGPILASGVESVQLTGGVDCSRFRPDPASDLLRHRLGLAGGPIVVTASRLVVRKGQDNLIRCWPEVLARHPLAKLLVVGDGPRREPLRELAGRLGVSSSIVMVGAADEADLAAALACGDIFALPCRDVWAGLQVEGLGLSILEASAAGLPVVVGRSGGSVDALVDGVTGILVDGRSVAEIGGALSDLLDDPERARALGRAGRDWVGRQWSWDRLADRLYGTLGGVRELTLAS